MIRKSFITVEDLKLGNCTRLVGVIPQKTLDGEGKDRFIVYNVYKSIHGDIHPNYYKFYHNRTKAELTVGILLLQLYYNIFILFYKCSINVYIIEL